MTTPGPGISEAALRAAIARDPNALGAHLHLAELLHQQNRTVEALMLASAATALAPQSADAHRIHGAILVDMDPPAALDALKKAVALDPASHAALTMLALAHARTGDFATAAETIKPVVDEDPSNGVARHSYDAWSGATSATWSPGYVETIFDRFAPTFDTHLRSLRYSVPEDTAALLHRVAPAQRRFSRLLDIGCGTGLGAAALARYFDIPSRIGLDLSLRMIEVATAKNLYTQLIHGDTTALKGWSGDFDLMIALDVFIYVGALEQLFSDIAPRLAPGGLIAYSIETAIVDTYELRPTGHYVHNPDYIDTAGELYGLKPAGGATCILREESGKRVPGYIGILQRA